MELVARTFTVGQLEFNKEELKNFVAEGVKKYGNLVIQSDEDYAVVYSDRTFLNSQLACIEDERKKLKKEFLKPLDAFEKDIKEIEEPLVAIIKKMTEQINEFELTRKKEKEILVDEKLTERGLFPYKKLIWKNEWTNKSLSMKKIEEDLDEIKSKISNDKLAIQEFTDNKIEQAEIEFEYNKTLDFAQSVRIWRERKKAVGEVAPEPTPVVDDGGDIFSITFKVTGSKSKLMALSQFLKSNNYQYEKLGQTKEEK